MLVKEFDIMAPYRPLPISYLIQTARYFSCTIHIQSAGSTIDVKDYEAMQQNFVPVVDDKKVFIGIVTRKDVLA